MKRSVYLGLYLNVTRTNFQDDHIHCCVREFDEEEIRRADSLARFSWPHSATHTADAGGTMPLARTSARPHPFPRARRQKSNPYTNEKMKIVFYFWIGKMGGPSLGCAAISILAQTLDHAWGLLLLVSPDLPSESAAMQSAHAEWAPAGPWAYAITAAGPRRSTQKQVRPS